MAAVLQNLSETTPRGADKVARYGWQQVDKPGQLVMVHKRHLDVNRTYQRDPIDAKIKEFAANWSWFACGVLVVARHENGDLWVVDGQHRLYASLKRSDITELPCIIFNVSELSEEAQAFLRLNTNRKAVSSIAKFKASVASEDEVALLVTEKFKRLGITVSGSARGPLQIKTVGWALRKAAESPVAFDLVISLAAELCAACPVQERLLDGLFYIHHHVEGGIEDKRLRARVVSVGAERLVMAANRASAYFARGGAKVWGTGMLEEINKGLHTKFKLREAA